VGLEKYDITFKKGYTQIRHVIMTAKSKTGEA